MTTTSTSDLSVTTTEHPNARMLRGAFDAFARGDLDAIRAVTAPDATWTNPGAGPTAGVHRGWDAIAAMFGRLLEMTGGTYRMQVLSVLADDRFATAVYDATSTIGGVTETQRWALVDEVSPEHLVVSTHLFPFDLEAAQRHADRANA